MHAVAPRMPLVTSCIPIGFAAKAVVSARTDVATGRAPVSVPPVPPVPVPVPVLPVLRFCGGAGTAITILWGRRGWCRWGWRHASYRCHCHRH